MASTSDTITTATSILLRLSVYVFLRWIVPPLATALTAIYIPSFLASFWSTSPYKVVSDEIDIITKETVAQGDDTPDVAESPRPAPVEELDVEETVVVQEKDPRIFKTLLTGRPSPSSALWSWITFAINILLVAMMLDLIYRAPVLYPQHDLSFARVGYVSDKSAKLMVREPSLSKLPIFVSYRFADPPFSLDSGHRPHDTAWKHAGSIDWLSEETDYTAAMEITHLRPDTKYQWVVSNNHSGYFITAPPAGKISTREANHGKYTFLHSSCIKPRVPYNPFQHPLSIPGFEHLAKWIDKLSAHFMLFLGDFIYIDVPIRHGAAHEDYRREYRQVYSAPEWPSVSDKLPWIHVLDDHEIENDWDRNVTGVFQAAYEPWRHYQVAVNPPPVRDAGDTYFSFTQGPASFFLMDTRRYREPEREKDTWDPTKSMLGPQQAEDLLDWIKAEPAKPGVRWKVVVSSIPFTKNWRHGPSKLDTWGGYLAERQRLLEAMWDAGAAGSGVGFVVLSGDRHEFAATAFPPPKDGRWPQSATVHEFSTSPLSMFYLPVRTYEDVGDEEDVCLKYIPDGNSKFGAIEITSPKTSEQSMLQYRLFVDGDETWSYTVTTPPKAGGRKSQDSYWG
ncbi:alkaline phosphatase family protein [Diplodia corticola]|uniref:Alkaline phosphatase family protein n=1 Tax=Diplodia corticola TaxID=236234 RepID=A0A1J9RZS2_9PEZI|nr:alkaline phosphatase family protein [Diplodia corticola]OJD32949.1 alkaline phosphatase family protein [Diplodia corticola]